MHKTRRSTGFGALQIWIRYLRTGIHLADSFVPTKPCPGLTPWDGASVTIGGGYEWGEVYHVVSANNKLIVGGGTPVGNYGFRSHDDHSSWLAIIRLMIDSVVGHIWANVRCRQ